MNNTDAEIDQLINELIEHGEDKNELTFWSELYPNLEIEEQFALKTNLQNELELLQKNK